MNNSVQNYRRESRQKLKCGLFDSLNISRYDYGRGTDGFKSRYRGLAVKCRRGQVTMK